MESRPSKLLPIAATVVWGLAGVASAIPAMFSVMLFDAPGSEENPATIALAAAMMGFPVACLIAVTQAWAAYRRDDATRIKLWSSAPLVVVAVGAVAAAWIEWFQGGKLAG